MLRHFARIFSLSLKKLLRSCVFCFSASLGAVWYPMQYIYRPVGERIPHIFDYCHIPLNKAEYRFMRDMLNFSAALFVSDCGKRIFFRRKISILFIDYLNGKRCVYENVNYR